MSAEEQPPSVKFGDPVSGRHYLSDKRFAFEETARLKEWAVLEQEFWKTLAPPDKVVNSLPNHIRSWIEQQKGTMRNIASWCSEYESFAIADTSDNQRQSNLNSKLASISQAMSQLNDGRLLSRENPIAMRMAEIYKQSSRDAWIYRAIMHPDADDLLNNRQIPFSFALQAAVTAGASENVLVNAPIEQKRLDEVFNSSEARLRSLDAAQRKAEETLEGMSRTVAGNEDSREKSFVELLQRVEKDWAAKLEVFNNQLALSAPTTYWNSKASQHLWRAIGFAIGFLFIVVGALIEFVREAGPKLELLTQQSTDRPIVAALAPIVVFAFAAVWVLRILGRQLSKNLALRDDAQERETMVKTFLALLNEKTERPTVSEKDRILILHALFRPSSNAAPDDAPPAHWFDLLTSRLGKPEG